jgi:hypothetical protein
MIFLGFGLIGCASAPSASPSPSEREREAALFAPPTEDELRTAHETSPEESIEEELDRLFSSNEAMFRLYMESEAEVLCFIERNGLHKKYIRARLFHAAKRSDHKEVCPRGE